MYFMRILEKHYVFASMYELRNVMVNMEKLRFQNIFTLKQICEGHGLNGYLM